MKLFSFGKKKEENIEKPDGTYYARYLGGHKKYAADMDAIVRIYKDRIDVAPLGFIIPYSAFKDLKNVSAEENVDFNRFLSVGIAGLLWNKRLRVTAIVYSDQIDTHTILLDFGPNLKYVQPVLYDRMIQARKTESDI